MGVSDRMLITVSRALQGGNCPIEMKNRFRFSILQLIISNIHQNVGLVGV